jgi:hypothetical protein
LDVALAKISVLTCNEVAVYTDLLSFEPLRSLVSRFRSQFLPSANGREVNFHGKKRSNKTYQSTTDPDAQLYKRSKGSEAKMSYLGHALIENRHWITGGYDGDLGRWDGGTRRGLAPDGHTELCIDSASHLTFDGSGLF